MAKVVQIKDNIIILKGAEKFKIFQFFELDGGQSCIVLSAADFEAKALLIGSSAKIKINQKASARPDKDIELHTGFFGKIINPFGEIIYSHDDHLEKGQLVGKSALFNDAPSILERKPINRPLDTGMLTIDTMIPIGRGQRELIIGDRVTGKSTIAINTIINCKESVWTIYVAIGQKKASVISLYETLRKYGSLQNTIILYANPDSAAEQFLAPMVGLALAEAISYKGNDALVVIDDLSKHANVYREISLSIDRNPGREAYPNDIFYMHARLLERGGRFSEKYQGGSITILPIVETVEGDIASLIPSNIISITDGQIFTNTDKFNKGVFPAIDVQLSISRTGSAAQSPLIKACSKGLRADHAKFEEVKKFLEMSIDSGDNLSKQIDLANQLDKIMFQFGHVGYSQEMIAFLTLLYKQGSLGGDFSMRDLASAIMIFFQKDPVGKSLKKQLKDANDENFEWITQHAQLILPHLINGVMSKHGGLFSRSEWNKVVKGEE